MVVVKRRCSSTDRQRICKSSLTWNGIRLSIIFRQDKYIPPKRPYSFETMLDDILEFSAIHLVDNGRLSLWMPTANDMEKELTIPTHNSLEIVSACVQPFNKCKFHLILTSSGELTHRHHIGSRRLLTYRRLPNEEVKNVSTPRERASLAGSSASDLNPFRKKVRNRQSLSRE